MTYLRCFFEPPSRNHSRRERSSIKWTFRCGFWASAATVAGVRCLDQNMFPSFRSEPKRTSMSYEEEAGRGKEREGEVRRGKAREGDN